MSDLTTPMMRQYQAVKQRHPDKLVLFRLGDFYEMFFEDARRAAAELDLTLTSRPAQKGRRIPMAGIPHHAADGYVARLVKNGHKVVLCDQVEDARLTKGLVRREVTRIITPGTILDPGMLDERANNYLAAVAPAACGFELAAADISTGEFRATACPSEAALFDELSRLRPAEVLVDPSADEALGGRLRRYCTADLGALVTLRSAPDPGPAAVNGATTGDPAGGGTPALPGAPRTAEAMLVAYVRDTQPAAARLLGPARPYRAATDLVLDETTRRNLELVRTLRTGERKGSLLWAIDATLTPMGGRLLRRWLLEPLADPAAVARRQDGVAALVENGVLREEVRRALRGLGDLERGVTRAGAALARPRELASLREGLGGVAALQALAGESRRDALAVLAARLDGHPALRERLERGLADDPPARLSAETGPTSGGYPGSGVVRDGFDPEVDRLRAAARDGRRWVAQLEARERAATGIKSLKVGYNRVFGYYLEVTRANLGAVPATWTRKQTLANADRFVTPELKEIEAAILEADERLATREQELFHALREEVAAAAATLLATAAAAAELDTLAGLAELAVRQGYVRPAVDDGWTLDIRGGRHPVVERLVDRFVPNETRLDAQGERLVLVTGPNMGGKSVYCRQVALIVILAQMGSFVPAEAARIGVVDRIFTRVGASDDPSLGHSTFFVELSEMTAILREATGRSLAVIDEFGRGTATYDGLALAHAAVEFLHDQVGCRTLYATHFHELTRLEGTLSGVTNRHVAVRRGRPTRGGGYPGGGGPDLVFLYRVLDGPSDQSLGLEIARLAGAPEALVHRAREILDALLRRRRELVLQLALPLDEAGGIGAFEVAATAPPPAGTPGVLTELAGALEALDLGRCTPLEALAWLHRWQERLRPKDG